MDARHPDRGDCYERTKHNPLEKALADQWEIVNKKSHSINYGQGLLQDLFGRAHPTFGHRVPDWIHVVTPKERWIVATVIQWLGSNCGQSFLNEAFRKAGFRIERIELPKK